MTGSGSPTTSSIPGVFIRSMGTRGHLGGLAEATLQTLLLLDASGKDVVFLETVGTGQSEVEVMGIADEVALVLMPGSGDSVQALKAGIMEIPDVIAINKMDQPGAKALLNDIRNVIALDPGCRATSSRSSSPRRSATRESRRSGMPLVERRDRHAAAGELDERRRRNLAGEVVSPRRPRARDAIEAAIAESPALTELVAAVQRRQIDPLTAVDRIVASRSARERSVTPPDARRSRGRAGAAGGHRAGSLPCIPPAPSAASSAARSRSRRRISSSRARSRSAGPTTPSPN